MGRAFTVVCMAMFAILITVPLFGAGLARAADGSASPVLSVSIDSDWIYVTDFAPDVEVRFRIEDGGGERWSGSLVSDASGFVWLPRRIHGVDLVPGMAVTAAAGAVSKELVVAAGLAVTEFHADTDTVRGTAPLWATTVGLEVNTDVDYCTTQVPVINGEWAVVFSEEPCRWDLSAGMGVLVSLADGDGDTTVAEWLSNAAAEYCRGVEATIVGTPGPDVITGTSGDDVIAALAGNDVIHGMGGNDRICGGLGRDRIFGDAGGDRIYGEGGDDQIDGGAGNDTIYGLNGADVLRGKAGNDQIYGGGGDDALYGDAGMDLLRGQAGDDTCHTGEDVIC